MPSDLMWALLLYVHPKSYYSELSAKDKITYIISDYLKRDFDPSQYNDTIEKMKKHSLDFHERLLANWRALLEDRDTFMGSKTYNEETYKMLDEMSSKTHAMWQQYKTILKEFMIEQASRTRGDVEESFLEKN